MNGGCRNPRTARPRGVTGCGLPHADDGPDQFAGTLLIFKVSAKISYGLVMEANKAIHVLDKVEKPQAGEKG